MFKEKIKVLIVDDSAIVRKTLAEVLSSDDDIEVIAVAADPIIATQKLSRQAPDVITLDIEMPRMDGLTFLKKIMQQHPLPVVICSSLVGQGSETLDKAIRYGAAEIIAKPNIATTEFLYESRVQICDAVKAAYLAKRATPSAQIEAKKDTIKEIEHTPPLEPIKTPVSNITKETFPLIDKLIEQRRLL